MSITKDVLDHVRQDLRHFIIGIAVAAAEDRKGDVPEDEGAGIESAQEFSIGVCAQKLR
jgi:hypothetical protein